MVSELHRMGYQRLRIMPFEYPLAYRVAIAPIDLFSIVNGAYIPGGGYPFKTCYTSAAGSRYFDWHDAETDSARTLADKFVVRFPDVVEQGRGSDWEYAGWLADLLSVLERRPNRLPMVMAEFFEPGPMSLRELPLRLYGERMGDEDGSELDFPLPPPGLSAVAE